MSAIGGAAYFPERAAVLADVAALCESADGAAERVARIAKVVRVRVAAQKLFLCSVFSAPCALAATCAPPPAPPCLRS